MADYTVTDLESWSYYQYPKLFLSQRSNAYLKNEYGDFVRDEQGNKIITHKIRETSDYVQMSDKAKMLYMVLFDRLCLSFKTNQELLKSGVSSTKLNFVDEKGATYIVFTNKEIMDRMDIRSENTVTKAKKELIQFGLLREQRMGVNKANRLYPQKIDATKKIIEHRCLETDEIIDQFDWQGNLIYHVEKHVETAPLTGTVKNEAPKITVQEPQKVQSIKPKYNQLENKEEEEEGTEKISSSTELEFAQEKQLVQEKQEALNLKYGEVASQIIDEAVLSTHQNLKNTEYYWPYLLKALDNAERLFKLKQTKQATPQSVYSSHKKGVPDWSHAHYENTTTPEELAQLERIKQESLEKLATH